MTTTQLITVTDRAERTVCYRLSRLLDQRLVAYARPYRDAGSAPRHWWLTPAGARLATMDTAGMTAAPNPLFLAHTVAAAGLWSALRAHGDLVEWRREEAAWEEWSRWGNRQRLAPDALAVVGVEVDGEVGDAHAFVEVDMGTMSQRRLRAKLARYFAYARDRAWDERHPHCPALLFLTTSERRAEGFLAAVAQQRPSRPHYGFHGEDDAELVVAACAAVSDPVSAVAGPVWRTGLADAAIMLPAVLGAVVAAERRTAAAQAALDAEDARRAPIVAFDTCWQSRDGVCARLGDAEAAETLGTALAIASDAPYADREAWARDHADVLIATAQWWLAANDPGVLHRPTRPPPEVVAAWRALGPEVWADQAATLLHAAEPIARADPRLRALAARVAAGELVAPRALSLLRTPLDGRQVQAEALGDHATRRASAARAAYKALPLRRRLSTDVDALADAYDDEHLVVCAGCGVSRPRPTRVEPCPICGGELRLWAERWLVPSIEDSLAAVADRLDRTAVRAGRRR